MMLDMARVCGQVGDVHSVVGNHIGLCTKDHLFAHTEGYKRPHRGVQVHNAVGAPTESDARAAARHPPRHNIGDACGGHAAIPFIKYMDMAYGTRRWHTL